MNTSNTIIKYFCNNQFVVSGKNHLLGVYIINLDQEGDAF